MFPHTKPLAGTQINPLHPLSQGLVGCWFFNEGAGSLANDLSGNKNHGQLTNMAPNVQGSGWGSDGLEFDEVDDYVDCGSDSSLDNLSAFTISMWVYPTGSGNYDRFAIKQNGWRFYINRFDYTQALVVKIDYSTTDIELVANNVLSQDIWQHVVATWNGSSSYEGVHLYVNGKEFSYEKSESGVGTKDDDSAASVYFSETTYPFSGSIRSSSIYNRALPVDEITWLHREPYAMFEPAFNPALLYSAAPPVGAIMNQFQRANIGADLYDGCLAI